MAMSTRGPATDSAVAPRAARPTGAGAVSSRTVADWSMATVSRPHRWVPSTPPVSFLTIDAGRSGSSGPHRHQGGRGVKGAGRRHDAEGAFEEGVVELGPAVAAGAVHVDLAAGDPEFVGQKRTGVET